MFNFRTIFNLSLHFFFQYQEFDVYDKYAHDILMPESREKLMYLLQLPNVRHSLQVWNFINHIVFFFVFF